MENIVNCIEKLFITKKVEIDDLELFHFGRYGEHHVVPWCSGRLKSVEVCKAYETKNHLLCGWARKVIQLYHLSDYNRVVQATIKEKEK